MKTFITIALTVVSFVIILDSLSFSHALMMFLLAGVVPGTTITLSADQMLAFVALLLGFITNRLTARGMTIFTSQRAQHSQPKAAALAK